MKRAPASSLFAFAIVGLLAVVSVLGAVYVDAVLVDEIAEWWKQHSQTRGEP